MKRPNEKVEGDSKNSISDEVAPRGIDTQVQGCKLLSDIGQCPTKFGKCPSKSNFDRTLVRSQKKIVTYFFCCDKIRLQIHQFAFCNKIYEAF